MTDIETRRLDLYNVLQDVLGLDPATTLMSHLLPAPIPDLFTKEEFNAFRSGEFANFRNEFGDFRAEMGEFKLEMREFQNEMREFKLEMREFKLEMRGFELEMRGQSAKQTNASTGYFSPWLPVSSC